MAQTPGGGGGGGQPVSLGPNEWVVHSSAAETTSANGTIEPSIEDFSKLTLHANVTAVSGTSPSMTIYLQGKVAGTWHDLGSLPAITAVKTDSKFFEVTNNDFRIRWDISGTTPSFTFTAYLTGKF